jgi:pimeloyl-ACP methyl ester carboxylesterase
MAGLPMPFLSILALQEEPMGWGTKPDDIAHLIPPGGEVEAWEDSGHFLHIEFPERTAERIGRFLSDHGADPASTGGAS